MQFSVAVQPALCMTWSETRKTGFLVTLLKYLSSVYFSDLGEFEQNFSFACPKFLSPVPPNYEAVNMMNFHKVSFLMIQLRHDKACLRGIRPVRHKLGCTVTEDS